MFARSRWQPGLMTLLVPFLSGTPATAAAQEETVVRTADILAPTGENSFYVGNRAPLLAGPVMKLPIGSVRPDGWLRHQLDCMAAGFTGHLAEISQWCRFEENAWSNPQAKGEFGWEELPYWLKGFIDLGYVLQDERIRKEALRWIEAAMSGQREDGYIGPESNRAKDLDLWPNMIMLYALRSYHEATGDRRVLDVMTKYFRWQTTVPKEKFLPGSWQQWRAGDNLDSIYWLYNRTGQSWLLDLAGRNHEHTADWTGGIPTWHGVNLSQCFREPAQYYQQARDAKLLQATVRNYDTVRGIYGQVPGGLYGADENCRPGFVGPRQGTETCTMVEIMHSDEMLLKITGDPLWADRCEDVAFNSLPCSMTADLKGLHYLTAPNQIQLDRQSKAPMIQNGGDMFSYNPHQYRCCQHNVAFGWPYFAEHLWMATPGNGLAAIFYAACTVKAKTGDGTEVSITETTDYPFDQIVECRISSPKTVRFPLTLRIPGWCDKPTVRINDKPVAVAARPRSWLTLERNWQNGDTVRLDLPMSITLTVWEKNKNAVSVNRGPLTYSLKIGQRQTNYGDSQAWPGIEVFPTTPWNYGLIVDLNNPASSFQPVRKDRPLAPQPFDLDTAPIELRAKGRRIPQWQQEHNGLVGEIQQSPVRSDEPTEDITLIPMGCARLRISAFPHIGLGPDANTWSPPPRLPEASHIHDSINAVNDGILPKISNDQQIPRFTWWDHKGSREWVQYSFEKPRRIAWCEVYWFDDTGVGHCRVPASWRILRLDGRDWKPVTGASEYGTKKDAINRATFDPVETSGIRLEVQLQPEFSGGILEWCVGEQP